MDNLHAYDIQADTIRVEDIVSDSKNRSVLKRIKRNNESISYLSIQNEYDGYYDYCPEGVNDMGWLGYFVGKHEFLEELYLCPFTPSSGASVRDVMEPFFRGVSRNKSIREIYFYDTGLLGGDLFTMLCPFFQNNYNLTNINVYNCDFGDEGGRLFALALGKCTHKSLRKVELEDNNIEDEGMVEILAALSMHPNLEHLDLNGNRLRKNGCLALATLLRCSATELQYLYLSNTDINDEGIEALVPILATCSHLKKLFLSDNTSITKKGWQSLATILEAPNSNLEVLGLRRNNINDEGVASFANVLVNNRTLHVLNLDNNQSITANGWEAFTNLLCDTSSVNATFLSNHTLLHMGDEMDENNIIGPLLHFNGGINKIEVAAIKILQSHDDFDMLPFFEWEFKVLPMVLSWLERASEFEMPANFEPNIDGRKLSTMYQFVRGLPLLYVETRLRKELEDIKAEESQMEDRKQLLRERKASIMKRLARQ